MTPNLPQSLFLAAICLVGCDIENRTVTVYPAHCEGQVVQQPEALPHCRGTVTYPLNRFQYTVILGQQTVVQTFPDLAGEAGAPRRLQDCAVKDADNWHCVTRDGVGEYHQAMKDGEYSSWSNTAVPNTDTVYVSAVRWYLLRYAPDLARKDGAMNLPRGIAGLELGMSPEQVGQLFTVIEDEDPVAALLTKYGTPEAGEAVAGTDRAIHKRFFRISVGTTKLPEGVTSADAYTSHDIVYQIGLHYGEANGKAIGWEALTGPYVLRFGKPTRDTGSGVIWEDGRTRLDIESSGPMINVFFTDRPRELAVKDAERELPDARPRD